MKKIIAFVIMTLLLVSVIPAVFADSEDATADTTNDNVNNRGQIKEQRQENRQEIENRKIELKQEIKDKKEELKAQLEKNREEVESRKIGLKKTADDFKSAKNEFKGCKGEGCKQKKINFNKNIKQYMGDSSDKILGLIDKAIKNTKNTTDINQELKDKLLNKLNRDRETVVLAQDKVNALNENSTMQEIKEAAKELRKAWQETSGTLKVANAILFSGKVGFVLERANNLENRLNAILAKLKTNETNVNELQTKIEQFRIEIEAAKKNREEGISVLASIRLDSNEIGQEKQDAVKNAHDLFKKSQEQLNSAHKTLKEIVKLIKEQNNGTRILEERADTTENKTEEGEA